MKKIGLLALLLLFGIQLLFYGVQTYLVMDVKNQESIQYPSFDKDAEPVRKPSSIEEESPSKGPIQDLKYQVIPDDILWNQNTAYQYFI